MKRSRPILRRASMALNRFSIDLAPKPFLLGQPLVLGQARIALLQREDVGRLHDAALVVEQLDLLLAQPLDVEGVARHEMLEALLGLGRADEPAGAAAHHVGAAGALVDLAHGVAAAGGADVGHLVGLGALRPLVQDDAHHLRDDVAGAAHDHRVADADVLARDLVLVVQRGVGHDHAADRDRLELGGGRERAGAADLDLDVEQRGGDLLGRELVGDGPARRARDEAQPLLPVEPVDLVDDAVDVVAERGALRADLAIEGQHLLHALAHAHQRIDRQAPAPRRPRRRRTGSRPAARWPRPSRRRRSATAGAP